MRTRRLAGLASLPFTIITAAATAAPVEAPPCEPSWSDAFASHTLDGVVHALAVYDDGAGPALYAGGLFEIAPGEQHHILARWRDDRWIGLIEDDGGSLVSALAVLPTDRGERLLVGGAFTSINGLPAGRIATWDGETWNTLDGGVDGDIRSLLIDPDVAGAFIAGGSFTSAGGIKAGHIARWTGATWTPFGDGLGTSVGTSVEAMAMFDDGAGPRLYAGGSFTVPEGAPADRLAVWDGASWVPVPGALDDDVFALTTFTDDEGPALYVGGLFATANGTIARAIARWNGTFWRHLDLGLFHSDGAAPSLTAWVSAMAVIDDGDGPSLYVGGGFTHASSVPTRHVARWDGDHWHAVGAGVDGPPGFGAEVKALVADPRTNALIAGGVFRVAGTTGARHVAAWAQDQWTPIGDLRGADALVSDLTLDLDGRVILGGAFLSLGDVVCRGIGTWDGHGDGQDWNALDAGVHGTVAALAMHDDGDGPRLYAAGPFELAGGMPAAGFARWDGAAWSAGPVPADPDNWAAMILTLRSMSADGAPALYAGGSFSLPGGRAIARLTDSTWTIVDGGLSGRSPSRANVIVPLGASGEFIVGGFFEQAGRVAASNIVRRRNDEWVPLGAGLDSEVRAIIEIAGETESELIAGGHFTASGETPLAHVARWDGSAWQPLGEGLNGTVTALARWDDGTGPSIYAAGDFTASGRRFMSHIARFDGVAWQAVDFGITGLPLGTTITRLLPIDHDDAPGLLVAGRFRFAGIGPSENLALRRGCVTTPTPDLDGDGSVGAADLQILLDAWGDTASPADLDGDGTVGAGDLAALLGAWTAP